MNAFEAAKKEYEVFRAELRQMYVREQEILARMQAACPHENTYYYEEGFGEEEVTLKKCKDCGKII